MINPKARLMPIVIIILRLDLVKAEIIKTIHAG